MIHQFSPLAQLAERRTLTAKVPSSILGGAAKPKPKFRKGSKKERIARLLRMGLSNSQIREVMGGNRQTINSIIWQIRNHDKAVAKHKQWYQDHKESIRKYQKEYCKANKEERNAASREYWANNAQRIKCKRAGIPTE